MRYFTELAYNGKNYFGWQIQPREISIQETLEHRLSTLLRHEIRVMGAGRTDTGVHAKKMFAHFDYEDTLPKDLVARLNSFLPKDIVVHRIYKVSNDAHARFDALERTYQYFVQNGRNPFNTDFSWQILGELDVKKMNEAAQLLLGTKDFSSFAKMHTDVKTHICTVKKAEWIQKDNLLEFTITADRFLRNMVRAIVGTLVEVGRGKMSLDEFGNVIEQENRKFAGGSAPPQGLFLTDVIYPDSIFEDE